MLLHLKHINFQGDDLYANLFQTEQINVSLAFNIRIVSCLKTQSKW